MSEIERFHASILVESGGGMYLIDCGEGATRSLLQNGVEANHIEKIVVSHTHPDHCAGIPVLLQYMYLTGRTEPLEIYLPEGAGSAFKAFFHQLYLLREKLSYSYEIFEYGGSEVFRVDDFAVHANPNRHLEGLEQFVDQYGIGINSFSLTFCSGFNKVYYSADLMGALDLAPEPGTGLMIVECTHIGVEEVVREASNSGMKRVIFTHIPPGTDTTSVEIAGVKVEYAFDGMRLAL